MRRSMSACMSSQMAHAHGRMTMLPRAGPFSASSARATTSWYHWGKSSPWGVSTASLATMDPASLRPLRGSGGSLLEQGPGERLAVDAGQRVVVAEDAEDVQHQLPGPFPGLAGALADGVQEGREGRVGLAVGGLGGGGREPGGRVGGLGGQAGPGQRDGHLGVGLDRAEQLDRLGRAALAQGQVGQAGPGGQVVRVLLQDLAPAGGGLGGVELGGGRGRPVGLAGQQRLDEPLDHLGRLGADELVDQAATGERLHRRDALDLEGHGQALVLVDVEPGQDDLAAVALHRLLQHRGQGVAGAAPVGPEVDQHGDGLGSFQDLGLEGGLGDVIDKVAHTFVGTPPPGRPARSGRAYWPRRGRMRVGSGEKAGAPPAATGVASTPRPATSSSTSSPGFRYGYLSAPWTSDSSRMQPVPQVPDPRRSARDHSTPLTRAVMTALGTSRRPAGANSVAVTRTGPSEVAKSLPLAGPRDWAISRRWMSRADQSFMTVNPATTSSASSRRRLVPPRPSTQATSSS